MFINRQNQCLKNIREIKNIISVMKLTSLFIIIQETVMIQVSDRNFSKKVANLSRI